MSESSSDVKNLYSPGKSRIIDNWDKYSSHILESKNDRKNSQKISKTKSSTKFSDFYYWSTLSNSKNTNSNEKKNVALTHKDKSSKNSLKAQPKSEVSSGLGVRNHNQKIINSKTKKKADKKVMKAIDKVYDKILRNSVASDVVMLDLADDRRSQSSQRNMDLCKLLS